MARTLRCRELGFDCDGVVTAETDDEVMRGVAEHAREAHGMETVPEGVQQMARLLIRDQDSPRRPQG